jgi:hypothetical protein
VDLVDVRHWLEVEARLPIDFDSINLSCSRAKFEFLHLLTSGRPTGTATPPHVAAARDDSSLALLQRMENSRGHIGDFFHGRTEPFPLTRRWQVVRFLPKIRGKIEKKMLGLEKLFCFYD